LHSLSEGDWDALVGQVYNAALHPETWGSVLESIGRPINAHAGQLVVLADNVTYAFENIIVGMDVDVATREFHELLESGDHVRASCGSEAPELTTVVDYNHSSEKQMKRQRFYQEHANPLDISYYGATIIKKSDETFIASVILRSKSYGHLDTDEVAYLNRLGPHLRRSIELSSKLPDKGLVGGVSALLENLRCGAVIVDNRFRIQSTNDQADTIISANDGITTVERMLDITDLHAAKRLKGELCKALGYYYSPDLIGTGHIRVSRLTGKSPYILIVVPLAFSDAPFCARSCVTLIVDPEANFEYTQEFLIEEYGLTPAESQVATQLMAGQTATDIANSRCCAIETVRSHIKSSMHKTGTSRQTDLVRVLIGTMSIPLQMN